MNDNSLVSDYEFDALMRELERFGWVEVSEPDAELEEKGLSLMDYVKQTYNYRADRVAQAIEQISGSEQQ